MPPEWIVFAVVLVTYLVYLPFSGYDKLVFDAAAYWDLADSFGTGLRLHLFDFRESLRGYSFPLVLHGLRSLTTSTGVSSVAAIRVCNAALVALLGAVLLPRLVSRMFAASIITLPRILGFNALIFIFWRDHLNSPLTDFPALTLWCSALLLVLRDTRYAYVAAGLAAGFAMNFRPAYMFSVVVLILFATWRAGARGGAHRLRHAARVGAALLVGVALALAPQVAINLHTFDTLSPLPPGTHGLTSLQLTDGLVYQKYETNIEPARQHPKTYFVDRSTTALLVDRHIATVDGYGTYLDIVVHHPIVMAAGYLRRVFNGLDVQYASPYVRDLAKDRSWLRSALLYSLFFAAANVLIRTRPRRSLGRTDWPLVALWLVPALTAAASAVETRFFLPATVLIYALVVFTAGVPIAWTSRDDIGRGSLVALYLLFVTLCFTLADATYTCIVTTGT